MALRAIRTPLVLKDRSIPSPVRVKFECVSRLVPCAALICISSTAICPIPSCRSFPVTRSSVSSMRSGTCSVSALAACRHSLARAYVRALPLLLIGTGKPLRCAVIHRLYPRRRFRYPVLADAAYAFPLDGFRSGRSSAVNVRRSDRLALVGHGGDGHRRPLRFWRRCPHSGAGLPLAGPRLRFTRPAMSPPEACAFARRALGRKF